jgi:hypothetical protein
MVVRANGSTKTYPDNSAQAGYMAEANGAVVVNHNLDVVRVTANGLETLATGRQIAKRVPGAIGVMGGSGGGLALSDNGTVYAVESVLARPHGCTSVIAQIEPSGSIRALWHSAPNQTCF